MIIKFSLCHQVAVAVASYKVFQLSYPVEDSVEYRNVCFFITYFKIMSGYNKLILLLFKSLY